MIDKQSIEGMILAMDTTRPLHMGYLTTSTLDRTTMDIKCRRTRHLLLLIRGRCLDLMRVMPQPQTHTGVCERRQCEREGTSCDTDTHNRSYTQLDSYPMPQPIPYDQLI